MARPRPVDILKAVVQLLLNDVVLQGLIGAKVYNHHPQDDRDFPYIMVRLSRLGEWDTQTSVGLDLDILVDCVTNFDGDEQALEIGAAAFDALQMAALVLDGGQQVVLTRYAIGTAIEPADGLNHRYQLTFHMLTTE